MGNKSPWETDKKQKGQSMTKKNITNKLLTDEELVSFKKFLYPLHPVGKCFFADFVCKKYDGTLEIAIECLAYHNKPFLWARAEARVEKWLEENTTSKPKLHKKRGDWPNSWGGWRSYYEIY